MKNLLFLIMLLPLGLFAQSTDSTIKINYEDHETVINEDMYYNWFNSDFNAYEKSFSRDYEPNKTGYIYLGYWIEIDSIKIETWYNKNGQTHDERWLYIRRNLNENRFTQSFNEADSMFNKKIKQ